MTNTETTKPYNQLQVGDTVTEIRDPGVVGHDVTFDQPFTVRSITQHKGVTVMVKLDGGRFWTPHMNDRRIAVLSA